MKGIKKLLTGILAATLIMGSSLNVCAADITITRDDSYTEATNQEQQTYTWYKMMDATVVTDKDGKATTAAYYVDTKAKADALTGTGYFKATEVSSDHYVIELADGKDATKEETAKAIAAKFAEASFKLDLFKTGSITSTGETTKIEGLTDGYYYITSTIGTNAVIQTLGHAELTEKNTYPKADKKQKDSVNGEYADADVNVGVGEKVYYQITVTVPAGTSDKIVVTDTMSAGLDFDPDGEIVVTGYGEGTAAVVNGRTFKVELPKNSGAATTSTITFTAVVNKDAIVDNGKKNDVSIQYGNYHQEDTVKFKLYRAAAYKYDGVDGTKLAGVKFTLANNGTPVKVTKHTDGYYYADATSQSSTVETNADGYIMIRGLDLGTGYTLTETETLTGYNLLNGPQPLTVSEDTVGTYNPVVVLGDDNKPVEQQTFTELLTIANNKGTLLPSTGGIGTTIFYIVGAVLVIAAVAYFILRRKGAAE